MDRANFKKSDKIPIYVDDERYYQIRLDDEKGLNIWWMFVPLEKDDKKRKGIHVTKDSKTKEDRTHFDFFIGRDKLKDKEYLYQQGISGVFMTNRGMFCIPKQYIFFWGSKPYRFYSPDKIEIMKRCGFKIGTVEEFIQSGLI